MKVIEFLESTKEEDSNLNCASIIIRKIGDEFSVNGVSEVQIDKNDQNINLVLCDIDDHDKCLSTLDIVCILENPDLTSYLVFAREIFPEPIIVNDIPFHCEDRPIKSIARSEDDRIGFVEYPKNT